MNRIELRLHRGHRAEPLSFEFERMINAGYVGRNQEEVQRHIEELAEKGIPAPKTTPILIPVFSRMLTVDPAIEVFGHETSGEAEYVLFVKDKNEIYVGLGSDHTDRHLEEVDISRSKQICPNIICRDVWLLDDVADHWDDLILRSETVKGGKKTIYQEGRLELILRPAELIDFVRSVTGEPLSRVIVFSGTLATVSGEFVFGDRFCAELVDGALGRRLELVYDVDVLGVLTDF